MDDLDRCPPDKSVEVLQALQLLTEGTPFIIYLAIDPRIVLVAQIQTAPPCMIAPEYDVRVF